MAALRPLSLALQLVLAAALTTTTTTATAAAAAAAAAAPAADAGHGPEALLPQSKEAYRVDPALLGIPEEWDLAPQYAGYLPVASPDLPANATKTTTPGAHLFFWMHESQSSPEDPLLIWLNGGPGCSSLLGMVLECGPFKIPTPHDNLHHPGRPSPPHDRLRGQARGVNAATATGAATGTASTLPELVRNKFSWNRNHHVIYVEQPAETGYSYAKDHGSPEDEQDLARDFYGFLRSFYQVFPEKRANHLFVFGESYAGMYGPSIAREIHAQNQRPENANDTIALKGLALGNGWVDPHLQTKSYPEYAYHHGLIDLPGKRWLEQDFEACLKKIFIERGGEARATAGDLEACALLPKTLDLAGRPNEFDVSTFLTYDSLLAPDSPLSVLLNDARVQGAIHVRGKDLPGVGMVDAAGALPTADGNRPWAVCNDAISMPKDHPLSMLPTLAGLLDDGYRVLLYNGENDLSCNFLGTEAYLDALDWKGKQDWAAAKRSIWRVHSGGTITGGDGGRRRQLADGTKDTTTTTETPAAATPAPASTDGVVAGYYRTTGPLEFLVVLNSGHLLPMDQPERALDLVYRFTRGLSFADEALPAPWADNEAEAAASGGRGVNKPVQTESKPAEAPGTVAARLRRHGLAPFLLAFFAALLLAVAGSALYRRRQQQAGYEPVNGGACE